VSAVLFSGRAPASPRARGWRTARDQGVRRGTVFESRGQYQLIVRMRSRGDGATHARFATEAEAGAEGLFDTGRKRPCPSCRKHPHRDLATGP
jgi:hypothetical protein